LTAFCAFSCSAIRANVISHGIQTFAFLFAPSIYGNDALREQQLEHNTRPHDRQ
jgi:hypothetical protein